MYNYLKGDLVICKPKDESKITDSNKEFQIYARVVDVDREADIVTLDRYLNEGRLRLRTPSKLPLARLENENGGYYQPMTDDEILTFRDGLAEHLVSPFRKKRDIPYVRATFEAVNKLAEKILRDRALPSNYTFRKDRKMDVKVSSITLLNREDSKTRAMATLVINDEFAIHGIKVVEGKNGDFVQMPQKRDLNGNYNDIIFPVTAEMREQINNAVLERYKNPISFDDLQLIGSYEIKCDIPETDRTTMLVDGSLPYSQHFAEKSEVTISQLQEVLKDAKQFAAAVKEGEGLSAEQQQKPVQSKIYASLHDVTNNNYVKAAGQIVIDDSIVITGVRVTEGTVKDTDTQEDVKKTFVNMPSYQTDTGDYNQYAHPITRECYDKINSCVMSAYQNIGRFTYKGVKFAELGGKEDVSSFTALNNKFAEKLMAELDKREIPYHAKIAETTTLSVKSSDKDTVESTRKELKESLTPPKPKQSR